MASLAADDPRVLDLDVSVSKSPAMVLQDFVTLTMGQALAAPPAPAPRPRRAPPAGTSPLTPSRPLAPLAPLAPSRSRRPSVRRSARGGSCRRCDCPARRRQVIVENKGARSQRSVLVAPGRSVVKRGFEYTVTAGNRSSTCFDISRKRARQFACMKMLREAHPHARRWVDIAVGRAAASNLAGPHARPRAAHARRRSHARVSSSSLRSRCTRAAPTRRCHCSPPRRRPAQPAFSAPPLLLRPSTSTTTAPGLLPLRRPTVFPSGGLAPLRPSTHASAAAPPPPRPPRTSAARTS